MIDPALLDRLQKADPDVYEEWKGMMITFPVIREGSRISDAWLQHVLQEAIASREWAYQIMHTPRHIKATVLKKCIYTIFGEGKTDTEALLRAYLGAIKE
jgi:hypothetical protein